jgi:4-hydroxybenzoate polyprenyltransferase
LTAPKAAREHRPLVLPLLRALRPVQWIKNAVVFAALVFSRQLFVPALAERTTAGFLLFCLLSSAAYLLNDLHDIEADRAHPLKRLRPLAAGQVRIGTAAATALALALVGLLGGFLLDRVFAAWAAAYMALQLAYSHGLRRFVLLDVLAISVGFVIRAAAGAALARVTASPWLIICTFLLALFLALAKRRHELVLLDAGASTHRASLVDYSPAFLDQALAMVAAATVVSYGLYTLAPEVRAALGTDRLYVTLPIVLYGVLRYLWLVQRHDLGGDPTQHLLADAGLLGAVTLWLAVSALLIYGT